MWRALRKSVLVALCAIFFATSAAFATITQDLAELPSNYPVNTLTPTGLNVLGGAGAAVVNGAQETAPTTSTVMADTGQLAVGCYVIGVYAENLTDTAADAVILAHRNAANSADVSTTPGIPVNVYASGLPAIGTGLFQVQIANANERVVARMYVNTTAAKIWQVDMALFPCR
jgi:hypothetical protein